MLWTLVSSILRKTNFLLVDLEYNPMWKRQIDHIQQRFMISQLPVLFFIKQVIIFLMLEKSKILMIKNSCKKRERYKFNLRTSKLSNQDKQGVARKQSQERISPNLWISGKLTDFEVKTSIGSALTKINESFFIFGNVKKKIMQEDSPLKIFHQYLHLMSLKKGLVTKSNRKPKSFQSPRMNSHSPNQATPDALKRKSEQKRVHPICLSPTHLGQKKLPSFVGNPLNFKKKRQIKNMVSREIDRLLKSMLEKKLPCVKFRLPDHKTLNYRRRQYQADVSNSKSQVIFFKFRRNLSLLMVKTKNLISSTFCQQYDEKKITYKYFIDKMLGYPKSSTIHKSQKGRKVVEKVEPSYQQLRRGKRKKKTFQFIPQFSNLKKKTKPLKRQKKTISTIILNKSIPHKYSFAPNKREQNCTKEKSTKETYEKKNQSAGRRVCLRNFKDLHEFSPFQISKNNQSEREQAEWREFFLKIEINRKKMKYFNKNQDLKNLENDVEGKRSIFSQKSQNFQERSVSAQKNPDWPKFKTKTSKISLILQAEYSNCNPWPQQKDFFLVDTDKSNFLLSK